jgi:uncharacterized protein (DUF39 family)
MEGKTIEHQMLLVAPDDIGQAGLYITRNGRAEYCVFNSSAEKVLSIMSKK